MGHASILPVRYSEILGASNAAQLISEYALECGITEIGEPCPQASMYEALQNVGAMQCFGVYETQSEREGCVEAITQALVGFASVLVSVLPHYGAKVATVESLFISHAHRTYGLARALLATIEDYAQDFGCVAILYSAPAMSRFDRLLAHLDEYRLTNAVYCRRLR